MFRLFEPNRADAAGSSLGIPTGSSLGQGDGEKCKICDVAIPRGSNSVTAHLLSDTHKARAREMGVYCICGRNFLNPANFPYHKCVPPSTKRPGAAPHELSDCQICGISLRSQDALKKHKDSKQHLDRTKELGYNCACVRFFSDLSTMERHKCFDTAIRNQTGSIGDGTGTLPRPPLNCTGCKMGFLSEKEFFTYHKGHKGVHSPVWTIPPENACVHVNTCRLCEVNLYQGGSLKAHKKMQSHIDLSISKGLYCLSCKKSFNSEATAQRHQLRLHDPNAATEFRCCDCQEDFSSKKRLEKHVCPGVPLETCHACVPCNLQFSSKMELALHLGSESHKPLSSLGGGGCTGKPQDFQRVLDNPESRARDPRIGKKTVDTLLKRRDTGNTTTIEGAEEPASRTLGGCEICGVTVLSQDDLNQHKDSQRHLDRAKELGYNCACVRFSSDLSAMERHRCFDMGMSEQIGSIDSEIVTPPRPSLNCTGCEVGFFSEKEFFVYHAGHKGVHSPVWATPPEDACVRVNTCRLCGVNFYQKGSLKAHKRMKSHIDLSISKGLYCLPCKKSFNSEATAQRHQLRLHGPNATMEFRCCDCQASFRKRKLLRRHACPEVPPEGYYGCEPCNLQFSSQMELALHLSSESHKPLKSFGGGGCTGEPQDLQGMLDNPESRACDSKIGRKTVDTLLKRCDTGNTTTIAGAEEPASRTLGGCEICGVTVLSQDDLNQHKDSQRHLDRAKELGYNCACVRFFSDLSVMEWHKCFDTGMPEQIGSIDNETVTPPRPSLNCTGCEVGFFSEKEFFVYHAGHKGVHSPVWTKPPEGVSVPINTCELCGVNFYQKGSWKLHKRMQSHIDLFLSKGLYCLSCKESFNSIAAVQSHWLRFHDPNGATGFRCCDCPASFRTKKLLRRHACPEIPPESYYGCEPCNLKFSSGMGLALHLNSEGHKPLKSVGGGECIGEPPDLRRTLDDLEGWACDSEIGRNTVDALLKRHDTGNTVTIEGVEEPASHELNGCEICGVTVLSQDDLKQHRESQRHLDRAKELGFNCPCIRLLSDLSAMKLHGCFEMEILSQAVSSGSETEIPPRPCLNCTGCEMGFFDEKEFFAYHADYKGVHSPVWIKPPEGASAPVNTCEPCGVDLYQRGSLKAHRKMQSHIGLSISKGLYCLLCKKSFNSEAAVQSHWLRFHDPNRPTEFRCCECQASFRTKKLLRRHACLGVPPESYHGCEPCNLKFSSKTELALHLNSESHKPLESPGGGGVHGNPMNAGPSSESAKEPKVGRKTVDAVLGKHNTDVGGPEKRTGRKKRGKKD